MTKPKDTTSENKDVAGENDDATMAAEEAVGADEFQLTIKKLEMPVRPRGVLAD